MAEISMTKNENLNTQIMQFADALPYYTKYLSSKLFAGLEITDTDINTAYTYFLEDAGLKEKTARPVITINYDSVAGSDFKKNLIISSLGNVEGVNALVEKQIIEFSPKLTVIYGVNGSGKSGYIRLLKKAFHSRTTENILSNIHISSGHKPTKADFSFITDSNANAEPYIFTYPDDADKAEFRQYSIFDNKCVEIHLSKNKPAFRPAGLNIFADLTNAFKLLEDRIDNESLLKKAPKDYVSLFDGESEIKTLLISLSGKTNISDLKKYTPFTEIDKNKRIELEKQKVQLQSLMKGKEISILDGNKLLLDKLKTSLINCNKLFSGILLTDISNAITDSQTKDAAAKKEGIDNFKTKKISNVGSDEWKAFIVAANQFAIQQGDDTESYPKGNDSCILCQQPLSDKAKELIKSYWVFIKGQAEQDAKTAQGVLDKFKSNYEGLKFDLLPEDGVLPRWLLENHPETLTTIRESLLKQKALADNIISDIKAKSVGIRPPIQIDTTPIESIIQSIDIKIKDLKEKDPTEEINKLNKSITYLNHKEKLEQHLVAIEGYVGNLKWAETALKAKGHISRRKVTDKEKELSAKYYNEAYVKAFNNECEALNGKLGIDISHTGSAGASFKQLFIKGRLPGQILSEGEQKVISLADFLAEMHLSEITRGIIFDDPVTSLDDERKCRIANRIIEETENKQVIVFTHDLVFVSTLICACNDSKTPFTCHWIEKWDDKPGYVHLNNTPTFEKQYRNSKIPMEHYSEAKQANCPPERREYLTKAGFTALRTCYETLVIYDMFSNVVQRFADRVSVDSLNNACFCYDLALDLQESFFECCKHMEGHSHGDKYAYQKPTVANLHAEITRYDEVKAKIKAKKKEIQALQAN